MLNIPKFSFKEMLSLQSSQILSGLQTTVFVSVLVDFRILDSDRLTCVCTTVDINKQDLILAYHEAMKFLVW